MTRLRTAHAAAILASAITTAGAAQDAVRAVVLRPAQVFDGETLHDGWAVVVRGDRIVSAGAVDRADTTGAEVIELAGATLLPGLIDAHSHVLLHPYNETSWNDQVLKESTGLRVARATAHLRETLMAGFTTLRDLGTEGAAYADAELKQAIEQGVVPGPRLLVATRAIVATGSYGPKGYALDWRVPQGAEEADDHSLVRVVRDQIGHGADWVKVYADYRWGPRGEAAPTFSIDELTRIVDTARSSGRPVAAHASTAEGMRRAVLAGVETIEHGDGGTPEVFRLMAERRVALCPTLAAGDAIAQYGGLEEGDRPGAGAAGAEARDVQVGARCRRHDCFGQRRRRLRARRQRAGAAVDGRLRDVGAGRASKRDLGRRARAPPGRHARPRRSRPAGRPDRRRRRSHARHRRALPGALRHEGGCRLPPVALELDASPTACYL